MTTYTAELAFVDGEFRPDVYLTVQGDEFVAVSSTEPDGEVVDFGNFAIFPGGVNTHTHSFQSLLRGLVDELDLPEWLQGVYSASADYGEAESYIGAALTFAEMLRSGTTTVADFFYLNARGNENARAVCQAARDVGIRLVMGRAALDADWGGRGAREEVAVAAQRFRELAREFAADRLITISPAPHSIYGASREMLETMHELALEFDTQWYVHVADSKDSADDVLNRGRRTIPVFEDWGILSERVVLAHALWLTTGEVELLAERGAKVSCNPASGMWFGDGILDVPRLWREGITVGLATDGAASNNGLNLFHEAHLASLGQKLIAADAAAVSAHQIATMMTEDGGKTLAQPVGLLASGFRADFIVLDIQDYTLQPVAALESNVVHGMSEHAIQRVYCGGHEVVRDGQLTSIDEARLLNRAVRILQSHGVRVGSRR